MTNFNISERALSGLKPSHYYLLIALPGCSFQRKQKAIKQRLLNGFQMI